MTTPSYMVAMCSPGHPAASAASSVFVPTRHSVFVPWRTVIGEPLVVFRQRFEIVTAISSVASMNMLTLPSVFVPDITQAFDTASRDSKTS